MFFSLTLRYVKIHIIPLSFFSSLEALLDIKWESHLKNPKYKSVGKFCNSQDSFWLIHDLTPPARTGPCTMHDLSIQALFFFKTYAFYLTFTQIHRPMDKVSILSKGILHETGSS